MCLYNLNLPMIAVLLVWAVFGCRPVDSVAGFSYCRDSSCGVCESNDRWVCRPIGCRERAIEHLSVPQKWSSIQRAPFAKVVFIKKLLKPICEENHRILYARSVMIRIQNKLRCCQQVTPHERAFAYVLFARYKMSPSMDNITALLKKMDIIPVSLALAQGILESGWGRSCAAVNRNSCFGHMATKSRVRGFSNIEECVVRYMHNLNVNGFYGKMRALRQGMRDRNARITGPGIVSGIQGYSVRGYKYIKELLSLIRSNGLEFFDKELPQ
ncbi:glucosaminidase domain-containing protein [Candidatus Hydrogenosomobacter endosymbioticus]|uniref:Mannosyl-glycoprotein endo-beta-N-acetylglucosamidase-like domain-containing protein n=1 Tax=Candidatus Hydrogenosomobacter endosymbioticus TaxID=2558174 RepID=A0ABM7V8X2_9PROT|nr:glucosaminidase domain-containing protein [Candidatus Hydrogenosomobacter endosymbioticus]BDB96223.1 hypothetical protein HYD_3560 [Candidatus Hydrogenosomobacter endosymbioticus]